MPTADFSENHPPTAMVGVGGVAWNWVGRVGWVGGLEVWVLKSCMAIKDYSLPLIAINGNKLPLITINGNFISIMVIAAIAINGN